MTDTNAHAIYALPLPSSSSKSTRSSTKGKRKRSKVLRSEQNDISDSDTEYSAVITPEERFQRRLAGHRLDRPPPAAPFPHAQDSRSRSTVNEELFHGRHQQPLLGSSSPSSLRHTHLGVMVAVLHKSLEQKEYIRATKAIAVILRTEISGRSIDIRHAGLWGIGAEILMRNHASNGNVSTEGFARTKVFYNRLALQHPWHRSWPNVVNAQDFKLAMFDLWVFTVCQESGRIQEQNKEEDEAMPPTEKELRAKRWELAEADAMSKEMDLLMGTVPFVDHLELIRLRAMVALWTADLLDAIDLLSADAASDDSFREPIPYDARSGDIQTHQDGRGAKVTERATASRNLAQRLFVKLGIRSGDTTAQEEEEDTVDMIY